jgi:type IV pilus assembly protein PilC
MVEAGEAGGMLDGILRRLAVFIEKQARLVARVRSAAVYPLSVLSIAAVVLVVILWKVVPAFTVLFNGLNATLPLATRIVIGMSRALIAIVPVLLLAGVGAAVLARRSYETPAGRLRFDNVTLRIPLVGPIARKVVIARFCRTMSALLGAGVPILDGLDISASSSGNAVVEAALRQVRLRIERGETVADPLRATGVFPPMVSQMIGAGETTGRLETMLGKIAEFYEEEVDVAIASLLTLVEPALISLLGVVVGGIVISMYLPLFDIISQLS